MSSKALLNTTERLPTGGFSDSARSVRPGFRLSICLGLPGLGLGLGSGRLGLCRARDRRFRCRRYLRACSRWILRQSIISLEAQLRELQAIRLHPEYVHIPTRDLSLIVNTQEVGDSVSNGGRSPDRRNESKQPIQLIGVLIIEDFV